MTVERVGERRPVDYRRAVTTIHPFMHVRSCARFESTEGMLYASYNDFLYVFIFIQHSRNVKQEPSIMMEIRSPKLIFREANRQTWHELERLFESRGGPKYCWCMAWRQTDGASRKASLRCRVENTTPIGILGYLDGEPVAWCSIAPRSTYINLGGQEAAPGENIWALACFFVVRRLRRQGLVAQLIEAAVKYARDNGATVVEAYPVDPESPSYRFMGYLSSFVAAGFTGIGRAGKRRHIMRLDLGPNHFVSKAHSDDTL
jgi:GNAT superfamily N-acetyltransferase